MLLRNGNEQVIYVLSDLYYGMMIPL